MTLLLPEAIYTGTPTTTNGVTTVTILHIDHDANVQKLMVGQQQAGDKRAVLLQSESLTQESVDKLDTSHFKRDTTPNIGNSDNYEYLVRRMKEGVTLSGNSDGENRNQLGTFVDTTVNNIHSATVDRNRHQQQEQQQQEEIKNAPAGTYRSDAGVTDKHSLQALLAGAGFQPPKTEISGGTHFEANAAVMAAAVGGKQAGTRMMG